MFLVFQIMLSLYLVFVNIMSFLFLIKVLVNFSFDSGNGSCWIINFRSSNSQSGIIRSSLPEVFCKKGVLRNFAKFKGKHLCQSLFLNKVAGLRHRCFPANFVKFPRTPFFTEYLWWLLLANYRTLIRIVWLKFWNYFYLVLRVL